MSAVLIVTMTVSTPERLVKPEGKKPFTSKEKKLLSMVISLMLMNPMSSWL